MWTTGRTDGGEERIRQPGAGDAAGWRADAVRVPAPTTSAPSKKRSAAAATCSTTPATPTSPRARQARASRARRRHFARSTTRWRERCDAIHRKADGSVRGPAAWSDSEVLAPRLARGRTRLAVFNACNSGLWPFVRPLMRAGIPAVVGVQGLVSNIAALNFAEKFYQSLAVGLSLDEALTYARLYVMQPGRSYHPCDWGRFMAYMPADSAVLFPRPGHGGRCASARTPCALNGADARREPAVSEELDGEGVSRMLSEVASRSVLILGRFTEGAQARARPDPSRPVDDAA